MQVLSLEGILLRKLPQTKDFSCIWVQAQYRRIEWVSALHASAIVDACITSTKCHQDGLARLYTSAMKDSKPWSVSWTQPRTLHSYPSGESLALLFSQEESNRHQLQQCTSQCGQQTYGTTGEWTGYMFTFERRKESVLSQSSLGPVSEYRIARDCTVSRCEAYMSTMQNADLNANIAPKYKSMCCD